MSVKWECDTAVCPVSVSSVSSSWLSPWLRQRWSDQLRSEFPGRINQVSQFYCRRPRHTQKLSDPQITFPVFCTQLDNDHLCPQTTTLSLDSTIKLPRVINIGVRRCIFDSFEPARRTYDVDVTVETMCQKLRLSCDDVTPGLVVAGEMCSVTVCSHRQRTGRKNLGVFVRGRHGLL